MRKSSIFSWFGFPTPMEERFKLIKAAGFDGVLLYWDDEYAAIDGDKLVQPGLARQNGLFVENIHAPIDRSNNLWKAGIDGDAFEKILLGCIEDCASFQIPAVVVHITDGYNPPPCNYTGLDRIKRLVEAAEKRDVNIALENLQRPDYLDFIYERVNSDRLGFCYDSGHENCYIKDSDILAKYGSKLMALHLHDNDGTDDQHLVPGEGGICWDTLVRRLRDTGYRGAVALEVKNEFSRYRGGETQEQFLRRAFQAADKLSGLIDI